MRQRTDASYRRTRRRKLPLVPLVLLAMLIGAGVSLLPRVLDRTPPTLTVEGVKPSGRYGGTVTLTIRGEDEGQGLSSARVYLDGTLLVEIGLRGRQAQTTYLWDTTALADGSVHLLEVELADNSFWHKTTRRAFDVIVDNAPPEINLSTVPKKVVQGQTLAFFVRSDEPLQRVEGRFLDRPVRFFAFRRARMARALVGVPLDVSVGTHTLNVQAVDLAGNRRQAHFEIAIQKGTFDTGEVQLPKSKRSLPTDAEKKTLDRKKRAEAFAESAPKQQWKGVFQKPAQGTTTSRFGTRRVYNNGVTRSIHLGWDIANRKGTPVHAANAGTVVLAEELPIHGKLILIDHGQGVFSGYAHLDAILVEKGEQVTKGQLIGRVGNTGQSTGPHLHWEMLVNGVPVDPRQWLTESFETP